MYFIIKKLITVLFLQPYCPWNSINSTAQTWNMFALREQSTSPNIPCYSCKPWDTFLYCLNRQKFTSFMNLEMSTDCSLSKLEFISLGYMAIGELLEMRGTLGGTVE